jgi:threonine aldolase
VGRLTPVDTNSPLIDLRSDAVTRPSPAMWEAMQADPLDWSHGGDRTVRRLESRVAGLLGMTDALFVPTGTMANTLALLCSTHPGDTFVVEQTAHVLRSEGTAYHHLAGLRPVTVLGHRGHPGADQVADAAEDPSRPSLMWLENTHTFSGGTVAPRSNLDAVRDVADRRNMKVHLDGARLWNAAVAQGRTMAELAHGVDSVTVNLDKGLGCPGGSLLCGSANLVSAARERMVGLGGRLAQAGLLAACGLLATEDFESALRRDHELARELSEGLRRAGVEVDDPDTNIVLVAVDDAAAAQARLADSNVRVFARDSDTIRFVTHRDVGSAEIARVVELSALLSPPPESSR